MKLSKTVFVILMGCFSFFGFSMAGDAAKTLPPGMVIGDSEGVYATPEGEYYIDLVNILPGETYEKEITIRSLDLEEPFSLGLSVEKGEQSGRIDWNEFITMTLTLDGEEIYQGPILGNGRSDWSKTPLALGVCKYGTDKILKAHFTIDSSLTNEHYRESNVLTFHWTFVGTKDQSTEPTDSSTTSPSSSSTPTSPSSSFSGGDRERNDKTPSSSSKQYPRTGEDIRDALYKFLVGVLLVLIVLFLWKKRKEEQE